MKFSRLSPLVSREFCGEREFCLSRRIGDDHFIWWHWVQVGACRWQGGEGPGWAKRMNEVADWSRCSHYTWGRMTSTHSFVKSFSGCKHMWVCFFFQAQALWLIKESLNTPCTVNSLPRKGMVNFSWLFLIREQFKKREKEKEGQKKERKKIRKSHKHDSVLQL